MFRHTAQMPSPDCCLPTILSVSMPKSAVCYLLHQSATHAPPTGLAMQKRRQYVSIWFLKMQAELSWHAAHLNSRLMALHWMQAAYSFQLLKSTESRITSLQAERDAVCGKNSSMFCRSLSRHVLSPRQMQLGRRGLMRSMWRTLFRSS